MCVKSSALRRDSIFVPTKYGASLERKSSQSALDSTQGVVGKELGYNRLAVGIPTIKSVLSLRI